MKAYYNEKINMIEKRISLNKTLFNIIIDDIFEETVEDRPTVEIDSHYFSEKVVLSLESSNDIPTESSDKVTISNEAMAKLLNLFKTYDICEKKYLQKFIKTQK